MSNKQEDAISGKVQDELTTVDPQAPSHKRSIHFQDVPATYEAAVLVSRNGGFIWINVDGMCAMRIKCNPGVTISIDDTRGK